MTAVVEMTGRRKTAVQAEAVSQFVSFWIERQLLGVPVHHVQEVLNPHVIAPVPRARPEVAGLLNLRGQIVTAVDLRRRLGLPPRKEVTPAMNVVVRHEGEGFSLLVDDVGDVIDAPADAMEPPPRTLDAPYRSVTHGVFRLEDGLLVVLEMPRLLALG